MTATGFFFRTLARATAIFAGTAIIALHPSLEWRGGPRTAVDAQQAPLEAAVDGLAAALKDTDAGVRRQAAFALGQIGNERSVPALLAAIDDAQPDVRRAVIQALGELGDAKAIDALTHALKDTDPAIRRAAAIALAQIAGDGPHPRPHPRPNPVVR